MSTQTPQSDDLKGKTMPFPVAPAKKSNDSAPTEAQEKDPISGEKGRVLILRRKRKRENPSIRHQCAVVLPALR